MTSAASTAAVCHVLSARSAAVCHALSTSRNGESAGTREWRGGGRDGGVPASCSTAAVSSQWGSACGGVGEANRRFGSGPRGAIPAGIVDAQDNCISVSMSQLDVVGGGDSRRGLCIRPACRTRNRSSSSLTNTEVKGLRLGSLRRSVQRNALQENSQSDGKGEVSGTGNDSVQPAPSGQQSSRSQQDDPSYDRKRATAIISGAIALAFGVGYIVLVILLDSRGAVLVPPPPEAMIP
ncbi:hypothetical protein CBR_g48191 [Chara braunii]|uniref:Uncharacterized protein n=1 Tax=Chara braunii TaxID=69332 RepID=A0A388M277_CHABU|nr:hypothetical protein CBR_g48191 [Chara braunii]|eukprot:GBG88661.1 hypothetical protein CBR_g48191 [Chara braunii]